MERADEEPLATGAPNRQTEERTELRGAAAGAVAGLGVVYLVPHLSLSGGLRFVQGVFELPFLLLSLTLVYAGYWLLRSDFCSRRVGRIAAWSVAGFLALVAIVVWLVAGQSATVQHSVATTFNVGAVGASSGLLVGLENERRHGRLDRDAAHATIAAKRAEERFAFFNRLLRHHLLNGVAVIRGHAELLADAQDDPPEEVLLIKRRSDEVVDLVRNVETLGRAITGDLPREPVDPVPLLSASIELVRREWPEAEVRTTFEECPLVVGNERVRLAFESLFRIALEAAEDDRVVVSAVTGDGVVVLDVEFDGRLPQPEETGTDPAERGESDLGLFLAKTLVEYFDGELVVDAEAGTGISVLLQTAE